MLARIIEIVTKSLKEINDEIPNIIHEGKIVDLKIRLVNDISKKLDYFSENILKN